VIQILSLSDFHGAIQTLPTIASEWRVLRKRMPTIALTGGDSFGASPTISALFDETPTILAHRLLGIDGMASFAIAKFKKIY
jgi:2',3'-cyclic-nucleotide 2'-phosphodiesterase (5'-nucleotidase family)